MSFKLSKKGQQLIEMYKIMVSGGYMRKDGVDLRDAFADFSSRFYRIPIKEQFKEFEIKTVLDYGCGGSDWTEKNFSENGESAQEFYELNKCFRYEPARGFDERVQVDCVISFDVLEHVFIADVENTLNDIFSYAKKLVILNIACYPANALLPNGENAHITVRDKNWWKAQLDNCALRFPNIYIQLLTSNDWQKTESFPVYRGQDWLDSEEFVIK
jgi:hypothetical protein|tara:strand:- start:69 stop:713 length:645 start_codon:yes stop_codon:yes gene_type:complete